MKSKFLGFILILVTLGVVGALPVRADPMPPPHLGYGMMLAYPPSHVVKVKEAGFDWFKYFARWNDVDGDRDGVYDWGSVDARLDEACTHGINLLLRVERDADDWTPIQDDEMDGWQALFAALAAHVDQKRAACGDSYRVAFEIWNEPNLDFQWNYEPVDPVRYTEMVRRAYVGARAGDPTIPIVVGSLAPTGGLPDGRAMDDVAYLEAMYDAGLQEHFDAVAIHNYGYGGEPEDKGHGWNILNFRRAEDIYQVLVDHEDGDKTVWGTEFGWLMDSDLEGVACDADWDAWGFGWQQVSAEQQADYLERAFAYADANWPWMEVLFVSNLDFSTTGWYATCDPLNWFAVLKADGAPRPAYTRLQTMAKRPRSWAAWGMDVEPEELSYSMRLRELRVVTETITVHNTGEGSFDWAVEASDDLPLTLSPITGTAGTSFTVTLDARALPTGTHSGLITVTASASEVPESPWVVPVTVEVSAAWGMAVQPLSFTWMQVITDAHPVSTTVLVENTGDYYFDWTVAATATRGLTLTVVPTMGQSGTATFAFGAFTLSADPRGLPLGVYTGTVTVAAVQSQVAESPIVLPVRFYLVERIHPIYLPVVLRSAE